ncbi:MAG: hypothetical protein QHH75_03955 [Bacillota bacterium]|nr:hypothetical protein [Bacillota bacterium]
MSFYGADDFIPTEEYDQEDAEMAIREADFSTASVPLPIVATTVIVGTMKGRI